MRCRSPETSASAAAAGGQGHEVVVLGVGGDPRPVRRVFDEFGPLEKPDDEQLYLGLAGVPAELSSQEHTGELLA